MSKKNLSTPHLQACMEKNREINALSHTTINKKHYLRTCNCI